MPHSKAPPPTAAALADIVREKGLWALAAFAALLFYRPLLLGEIFFFRDLQLIFLPQKQILSDMLRAGEIPWWNVYLHGGVPFLADIQTSGFYPTTWLHGLLPPPAVLTFELIVHTAAAAVCAYLLARRLGLTPAAAFLTGGTYAFCGYTLSKLNIFFHLLAAPYLPLLLLCWHAFLREGRRRWFLAAVLCATLQVLTGSPEAVVLTLVTALGWGLCQSGSCFTPVQKLVRWVFLGAAMAGLSAVQLVPMAELVLQSARGEGLDPYVVSYWSLDPRRLPELIIPGFLGDPLSVRAGDYWGAEIVDRGKPFMLSLYFGLLPFALALYGGIHRGMSQTVRDAAVRDAAVRDAAHRETLSFDRRLRAGLSAFLVLGIVLALGRFLPFYELLQVLPGFQFFRYPIKFLNLSVLPVALLAGVAIDAFFPAGRSRRRPRMALPAAWTMTAALGLFALLWTAFAEFRDRFQEIFFEVSRPEVGAALARQLWWVAGIALLAAAIASVEARRPRRWRVWALTGVAVLDLTRAGMPLNPTTEPETLTTVPPAAERTLENLAGGRFFRAWQLPRIAFYAPSSDPVWLARWNQEILTSSLAIHYRIPVIYHADIETLAPHRLMKIKGAAESVEWPQRLPLLSAAAVRVFMTHQELDLAGVERVATIDVGIGARAFLYRNLRAAARDAFVTVYYRAPSGDAAMGAMLGQGFDPRRHAVVEGEAPPAAEGCRAEASVEVRERGRIHRELAVRSRCPGLLVLAELFYPGWEVTVDGRPAELLRANVAFSAVWLDAGEHQVEWRYVPRVFAFGLALSALTAAALAIWLASGRRRRPDA